MSLERSYFVIPGNEYGFFLEREHELYSLSDAEELFKQFMDEYGCVAMYKIEYNEETEKIVHIKTETDLY